MYRVVSWGRSWEERERVLVEIGECAGHVCECKGLQELIGSGACQRFLSCGSVERVRVQRNGRVLFVGVQGKHKVSGTARIVRGQ